MSDIRVGKITVGTPSYRAVVGDITRVQKVVVGVPTRNVLISNSTLLNDVVGITTSNLQKGDLLVVDSDGILVNSKILNYNQEIDGRVYERDSDRAFILIRRSATEGAPTNLRGGELAYSYLTEVNPGGTGNGGDRLYIGVDSVSSGFASRIDVIGGRYFTGLLDHTHGVLTASSAVIVDSDRKIDEWFVRGDLTSNTLNVSGDATITGELTVESIRTIDLIRNFDDLFVAGEGIDLIFDSVAGKITILAEFASTTNAGISSFDSTQFSVTDGGVTTVNLDGGSF